MDIEELIPKILFAKEMLDSHIQDINSDYESIEWHNSEVSKIREQIFELSYQLGNLIKDIPELERQTILNKVQDE